MGNLSKHSDKLSEIGSNLSSDADILFYGCEIAKDSIGEDFVDKISKITGADIMASNDLTGAKKLNGDSVLEYSKGKIDTAEIITAQQWNNFDNVLADGETIGYWDFNNNNNNAFSGTIDSVVGSGNISFSGNASIGISSDSKPSFYDASFGSWTGTKSDASSSPLNSVFDS